jgi:hypothetical protein
MRVTKKSNVRDPRDAYYDKKTGTYFNHNFWNIENAISDIGGANTEDNFLQRMSPPYAPSGSHTLPRVISKGSPVNHEGKLQVYDTAQVFHCELDKGADTTKFTLRLAQKEIVQHPLTKPSSQSLSQSSMQQHNSRPKSAAAFYQHQHACSRRGGVSRRTHNNQQDRPHSSPSPIRIARSQSPTISDDTTYSTRQILSAYIDSSNNGMRRSLSVRSHSSTVTPASFGRPSVQNNKPRAWVQAEAERTEDVTDLGKIFQKSKEKNDMRRNDERKVVVPEHSSEHPRGRGLSLSLCKGSNWRKKERLGNNNNKNKKPSAQKEYMPVVLKPPADYVPKLEMQTLKSSDSMSNKKGKNNKVKVACTLPTYNADYSIRSFAKCSEK